MRQKENCKGNCPEKKCLDCAQIQQRIFEREVDEELQQERLRELWQKYRFVVLGIVLAVIFGTIGSELYHSWKVKTQQAESDRYENAMVLAYQGNVDQAVTNLKLLGEEGHTGYRYLAQLEEAGLLLSTGKKEEAMGILKQLADNSQMSKPLHSAVVLAYVGNQLENGNVVELQQYLLPLQVDTESVYFATASELSALLHILSGENDLAVQKLEKAAALPNTSEQVKTRINTLLKRLKK